MTIRATLEDTMITSEHINNECLLVDGFFWLVLFLLVFVLIELAASISMIPISILCACNFTLLLYLACTSSFCSIQVVKPLTLFMWGTRYFDAHRDRRLDS